MLEMCKDVLTKVSFDPFLFQKELRKSTEWIQNSELLKFKQWCIEEFGKEYSSIITEVFANL